MTPRFVSRMTCRHGWLGVPAALWLACGAEDAPRRVRVAAASDLATVFEELGPAFERAEHVAVDVTLGSSGLLSRQLAEGAPYDAFLAADVALADRAVASGACDGGTRRRYARGHLALWSTAVPPPAGLADLAAARFARVAIANPEHAPYGRAARQALRSAGVWEQLEGRVVRADNVRQALELARTGNADAAIVARSLVAGAPEALDLDEALHDPIVQVAVACRNGPAAAAGRRFVSFLASADARRILERHGLGVHEAGAP